MAIVNKAPVVVAGEGATDKYKVSIPLMGVITDDGFGNEDQRRTIKILWEKESGPEEPTFKNAEALETTITFMKKGVYVLKVTANNGYDSRSDTVTFTVNEPPPISFGGKRSFSKNSTIELVGVIDDDGLGDPEEDMGKIGVHWEQTKGPTATIDNKTILNPKVKILQGKPGTATEFRRNCR